MKKLFIVLFVVIIFIFGLNNFLNSSLKNNKNSAVQITTSFYPLYFFVEEISKDKLPVFNVTPAGIEPHDYEPSAGDMSQIENSKLIILNGGLEPWEENIKKNIDPKKTQILTVGENLTNEPDYHFWLSPSLSKKIVEKITREISKIDSKNAVFYEQNSTALESKLEELDNSFRQGLKNCKQKDIITSHSAFNYLAKEYGLNQISIAGLSPDAEPSAKKLSEIATFAKENNIKYIFFESLVSTKLSNIIANEIGAKTLVLNPIEGLTKEESANGENYFTKMYENLSNLQIALECQK